MSVSARLAELGIELPAVAAPVAAYVPAVIHGGLVYTSGQLPFTDGALPATGKLGAGIDPPWRISRVSGRSGAGRTLQHVQPCAGDDHRRR